MRASCLESDFDDIKRVADDDPDGSADVASPEVCRHEISIQTARFEMSNAQNLCQRCPGLLEQAGCAPPEVKRRPSRANRVYMALCGKLFLHTKYRTSHIRWVCLFEPAGN